MAYGIRVARPGYNASTCADFETAFDSRYPNLKIAFQGAFTTTSSISSQTVVTHNLGYAPVFVVYVKRLFSGGEVTLATTGYSQFLRINSTNLIYSGGLGEVLELYYYIFHQRIDQNITYNTVSNTPTTQGTATADYGIRVAKSGFDATTASPKNLAWSSEYPSPIIQKMDTGTFTSGVEKVVSHGLNYYPQCFLYVRNIFGDGRWQGVFDASDSYLNTTTSQVKFYFAGVSGTYDYGLLILKDPIKV
ncbi:MAG: hypothetical protein ACO3UU_06545 [Minisyncoccia bacterium]